MGEMNPMVKTFNDAIAKSGIQIEMYRDDYRDEWKVKVDTSKHDAEVKAESTIELFALLSKVKDKTKIWNKFSTKKVPYRAIDVICDWIIEEQSKEQDNDR